MKGERSFLAFDMQDVEACDRRDSRRGGPLEALEPFLLQGRVITSSKGHRRP